MDTGCVRCVPASTKPSDGLRARFPKYGYRDRFESSFDYDVEPDLERITAPVLTILFADDELNPPEVGTMERVVARVKNGRMVLVPAGPSTETSHTGEGGGVARACACVRESAAAVMRKRSRSRELSGQ